MKFQLNKWKRFVAILIVGIVVVLALSFFFLKSRPKEGLVRLYENLKEVDKRERAFAVLSQSGRKAGDYLAQKLATEKDVRVKWDLVQLIGLTGCSDCEGMLIPLLNDPDWRLRIFVIDALAELGFRDLRQFLYRIIADDMDNRVKAKAIMTLGKIGHPEDITLLKNLSTRGDLTRDEMLRKAIDYAEKMLSVQPLR